MKLTDTGQRPLHRTHRRFLIWAADTLKCGIMSDGRSETALPVPATAAGPKPAPLP